MPAARSTSAQKPYWLSGEELCNHCHHPYAQAVQAYCGACDDGVCPHCVIVIQASKEVLCPVCQGFHAKEEV